MPHLSKKDRRAKVSANEARRRKEVALARLRELEVGAKEGKLLDLDEVRDAWCGLIVRARDILLAIAPEIRDRLAVMTDPIDCGELVDAKIRAALELLSTYRPGERSKPRAK